MNRLLVRMILLSASVVIFQTSIKAQPDYFFKDAAGSGLQPVLLPNRTTLSFSGAKKQNGVELKGVLSSSHSYNKVIIERTNSASSFFYIGEMDLSGTSSSNFAFTFLDTHPEAGINYYRIRLENTLLNIQEISNTLMVKMDNNQKELEVINTLLRGSSPVLSIRSHDDQEADLQFTDMSGRIVNTTRTKLNSGFNNINLSGFDAAKGYFVIMIRTDNNMVSRKILIQ